MPLTYAEKYHQAATCVEQYRRQVVMDRMRLSKSLAELINYTQQNIGDDTLIYPIKNSPIRHQSACDACRIM